MCRLLYFYTHISTVLYVISNNSYRRLFPGIFISPLIDMCGCRAVAMTMAFVYATATALSALAPTIGSLYFIYSFLTGNVNELN